jgi:hypothetical protein
MIVRALECQNTWINPWLLVKSTEGGFVAITGKAQKQGRVEADPVRKEEPYSSLPQPQYITIHEYKSKYIYPSSVKSGILRERRSGVCQWEGRNMSKTSHSNRHLRR